MKVYLIRHAQSEENILNLAERTSLSVYNDILRRSPATPLTPHGESQAQAVAKQLADKPIQRLYSSPFARALTTARIIGAQIGLEPHIIEELREVLPPPMTNRDDRQDSRSLRRRFISSYLTMMWPRGEDTWAAGYRRVKAAWSQIIAEPADEIVAVAHRGTIGLILLSLQRNRNWQIMKRDLTNCGVSIVVRKPNAEEAEGR